MKKQILSILLALVSLTAIANEKDPAVKAVKKVAIKSPFQKLVVNGNIQVILFEDTTTTISIVSKQKQSNAVVITESKGVLTIKSTKVFGKPIQVVVPVKGLRSIEAGESCSVSGVTAIDSPELELIVNNSCQIKVRTTGHVSVVEGTDVEEFSWARR